MNNEERQLQVTEDRKGCTKTEVKLKNDVFSHRLLSNKGFEEKILNELLFATKTGFLVADCPSSSRRRVAGTLLAGRETEPSQEANQEEQVMRDTCRSDRFGVAATLDRDAALVRRLSGLRDGCRDLGSFGTSLRFSSSTGTWAVAAAAFGPGAGVTLPRGCASLSSVRRCPGHRSALRSRGDTALTSVASVHAGGHEAARIGRRKAGLNAVMIVRTCLTRLLDASSSHAH